MNVCRSMSYAVSWCKNVMQSESVTVNKQSSQMKTKKNNTEYLYMKIIRTNEKNELEINMILFVT